MSNYSPLVKTRKLDSDSSRLQQPSPVRHFLDLPEEMISKVLSYVGTNVGEENPYDDQYLPDSTKQKFKLSMICRKLNYLIKKRPSWEKNNVLTIYPKNSTIPIGNGVLINGIFFPTNKAVQALGKLLGLARIKQLIVVDITQWAVNDHDDSKSLREGMLECFQKNEQRLKGTVDKLTMHGYLNDNNIRDLVLWLCNTFPNLRSVDLTVPVNDVTADEKFQLKFEETEIVNCPLEKVKLSRFQNSNDLFKVLDGKRIRELTVNIEGIIENGTQSLTTIISTIADGTLEKLVISPYTVYSLVIEISITQWLAWERPEVLSNLRHLEFEQVNVSDIADLANILTLLPTSLLYLKINCYKFILGNRRIQMFRFLTHVIMAFFETTTIEKGEFNFRLIILFNDSQFRGYRKFAHRQWEGISVEQMIPAEAQRLSYKFRKYGRCITVHIR